MGDDKTKWSNVIIGPWPTSEKLQNSKPLKGGKTREQIVQEEMDVIDGLSESIMVNVIHTLKENDVKIGPWFRLIKDNFLSKIWRNLESIENINDNEVHHMGEVE